MKNMRKLLALVLAVMMVMSLAANAFAAEDTTTITISGGAAGSQYTAYKLLNATHSAAGDEGEDDDHFAYTLNDKYTAILQSVTGKTKQADIIDYISKLTGSDIQTFADNVYAAIVAAGIAADYTTADDVFADVAQGYYLIAETIVGDPSDTYSLVMLDTKGDAAIEVATKEDKPKVDKQVEEVNDSTKDAPVWGETADHDIKDKVNYQIIGTVSNKYADYESYYYSFTDTMSKGLTYNGDAKVYVVNNGVKTDVTSQFTITTFTKEDTEETGFIATSNLKELSLPEGVSITATTTIVVEYSCTLNENAVIGAPGNPNDVYLEYENNPYHKGDGTPGTPDKPEKPGKTPEDICIVFTFESVVNKVDKDGNALEGAGFTLYKWYADQNEWVAVGAEITGKTTFNFAGLDVGKYKLVETTIPQGYNKADDVEFEIVAEYTEKTGTDGDKELTGLKVVNGDTVLSEGDEASFAVVVLDGVVSTNVVNNAGVELPSTGGIGTTIFYALGGILVLAAVVLLVTKKRMSV